MKVTDNMRQNSGVPVTVFNQQGNALHCKGLCIIILNESSEYSVPFRAYVYSYREAPTHSCVAETTQRREMECMFHCSL
jgi:hypothetical protein